MKLPSRRPELLCPAGSLKSLRYAYAYGADAVYAGLPRYSLRVRNNEFRKADFVAEGIRMAREQGKSFFLAINLTPHNRKLRTFVQDIAPVLALKPDALIMADPGLIMLVRENWPDIPVHLSVQANAMNFASVKFWQKMGLTRVILSRELSLDEISEIRQECPDMELEVFVHGALCMAHSGRCLLSGYFSNRDSNQGACTNACRWNYSLAPAKETAEGVIVPEEKTIGGAEEIAEEYQPHPMATRPYLLQENGRREGEWMEFYEDESGSYIMNSRDLRAVEHVRRLVEIGVDSLKIEGRTKSHYYAARTAQIYRRAIDDAVAGKPFDPRLMEDLDGLANRGYTDGFLGRHESHELQNYATGQSRSLKQEFVAEVLAYDPVSGLSTLDVKNRFATGDRLQVISPEKTREVTLATLLNKDGGEISVAPGNGHVVRADIGLATPLTLVARYLA